MTVLRVAVIGSGPSGSYAAQLLTEESEAPVEVDVFERLPAPFGLVRYGVAPDHPRIKSIMTSFAEVFEETPGVRFLGNVHVGTDISLDELRTHYDAVIFATGAPLDRALNIPGEDLGGVHAVREFVSWYGGHPDSDPESFALTGHRAVVVGVGNVALDAARMLMLSVEELRATDVPEHVVDAFAASSFREVVIVGRRGPAFAKFTNKEFLEFLEVESCDVIIDPADLEIDSAQQAHLDADPNAKRLFGSFQKAVDRGVLGRDRRVRFVFDRSPVELLGEDGNVAAIRLEQTSDPSISETLETQLVLRSVGYRGKALDGLPFNEMTATVPHVDSRVADGEAVVKGVYIAGWIKRGPNGVVGTNRRCALETVTSVLADIAQPEHVPTDSSAADVDALLASRDVRVVDWTAWKTIEAAEIADGESVGRARVKLHDRADMLRVAHGDAVGIR